MTTPKVNIACKGTRNIPAGRLLVPADRRKDLLGLIFAYRHENKNYFVLTNFGVAGL